LEDHDATNCLHLMDKEQIRYLSVGFRSSAMQGRIQELESWRRRLGQVPEAM